MASGRAYLFIVLVAVIFFASPSAAFGAGNIASISKVEGKNFRHGDIEDFLKFIACVKGHKWTSLMIKRVYFGNWLRDYSQALDVGTLKTVQADTIRILVWVLSFLGFGYATGEFEVTADRLGVYRPEEHIDNPRDYADNADARQFDPRLRPPVQPIELAVDPETGMKNYIANEKLGIATSIGYVKYSLGRSIHYGRVYSHGTGGKGKEDDLCEALRCLGQALHCLEDWGAHTNYVELVLREMGFSNVFPHTGTATQINLRGRQVFPLVTGTFGVVDFLHSVIGEATDNLTSSEVDQMDATLLNASVGGTKDGQESNRSGPDGSSSGSSPLNNLTGLLGQMPGAGGLVSQAQNLQQQSNEQARANTQPGSNASSGQQNFAGPPGTVGGTPTSVIPGTNIDPAKTLRQIYPILEFRDKVAKAVSATIEKIPGLQALVEKIMETVTLFILSLLAPFIRPIIDAVSKQLKTGSSGVIGASGRHQYEPWTDPHCTDPTHSLLSKDHFSNILNEPAGKVASTILQYVAPRVIYGWENPSVPVDQILNDVVRVFHHPAIRDQNCEIHRSMFGIVETWARARPDGGRSLDGLLSADSVRHGKNHEKVEEAPNAWVGMQGHSHNHAPHSGGFGSSGGHNQGSGQGGHGFLSNLPNIPNLSNLSKIPGVNKLSGSIGGAFREAPGDGREVSGTYPGTQTQYDNLYPPQGIAPGPSPQPLSNPYGQPPSSGPNPSYYGEAQQYQQGYQPYQQAPQQQYQQPQQQYQQQPQQQYQQSPYDPNAPPPQQQYDYSGGSQGQYYGGPPRY